VTLILTLDRVIRHTVVYHSPTSVYRPNFVQKGLTFCGRTDVRTRAESRVKGHWVSDYVRVGSGQSYFGTDPVSWPGFWQNNGMIQRLFICWEHMNELCKVGAQCVRWHSPCTS